MSATNHTRILLEWCQRRTKGYRDVNVTNWTTSWGDGMALCAIIHSYRPELIDFESLKKENAKFNVGLALNSAEKLGIEKLLDVEDITDVPKTEPRSMTLYLSYVHNYFAGKSPESGLSHILETTKEDALKQKIKTPIKTPSTPVTPSPTPVVPLPTGVVTPTANVVPPTTKTFINQLEMQLESILVMRSWRLFFSPASFKQPPHNARESLLRLRQNLLFYVTNYIILVCLVFSVVQSYSNPWFLLAPTLILMASFFLFRYSQAAQQVRLLSKVALLLVLSMFILWVTESLLLFSVGGAIVIGLHALLHKLEKR